MTSVDVVKNKSEKLLTVNLYQQKSQKCLLEQKKHLPILLIFADLKRWNAETTAYFCISKKVKIVYLDKKNLTNSADLGNL